MEKNFYKLLEIIEAPKRLNSIQRDKYFDYLLESLEDEERFGRFMEALYYAERWAYIGIGLMCSDVINLKEMFSEEIEEEKSKIKSYTRGTAGEGNIINNFFSYLSKALFAEKKYRAYFIHLMSETLTEDGFNFMMTCFTQAYKKEVYPFLKKLYEKGLMRDDIKELFGFCINREADLNKTFTKSCLPIKEYTIYNKVGNMIFKDGLILDDRDTYLKLQQFIRVTSSQASKMYIQYPNICEIWVSEGEPFMIRTTRNSFVLRQPVDFSDSKFIQLFYEGYETFLCCSGVDVVSILSKDNGMKSEKISLVEARKYKFPLLILGSDIDILIGTSDEGKDISALIPSNVGEIELGKKHKFISFNDARYFVK